MVLVAVAVISAGFAVFVWVLRSEDLSPVAAVDLSGGDTIRVSGWLSPGTAVKVRSILERQGAGVKVLRVSSGGGEGSGADDLARLVNGAGLVLRVDTGALCSSACVLLIARVAPRRRSIDGGAWVRVHGYSTGPGDPRDLEAVGVMDEWVATISPAWSRFLLDCRSRPLRRMAGLAMTWAEVLSLQGSPRAVDCDKIAYRTKEWVMDRH